MSAAFSRLAHVFNRERIDSALECEYQEHDWMQCNPTVLYNTILIVYSYQPVACLHCSNCLWVLPSSLYILHWESLKWNFWTKFHCIRHIIMSQLCWGFWGFVLSSPLQLVGHKLNFCLYGPDYAFLWFLFFQSKAVLDLQLWELFLLLIHYCSHSLCQMSYVCSQYTTMHSQPIGLPINVIHLQPMVLGYSQSWFLGFICWYYKGLKQVWNFISYVKL